MYWYDYQLISNLTLALSGVIKRYWHQSSKIFTYILPTYQLGKRSFMEKYIRLCKMSKNKVWPTYHEGLAYFLTILNRGSKFTYPSLNEVLITICDAAVAKIFWYLSIPYRAKVCRAKVKDSLKRDMNFARLIILPYENFARQNFAQRDNHNLSKWLFTLIGSLVFQFKTL